MKYIVIKAGTNDASHTIATVKVSEEQLNKLYPVFEAIKNCKERHNWPDSEHEDNLPERLYENILTQEQIDFFRNFVSYGEYGIHTITSIKIMNVIDETDIL